MQIQRNSIVSLRYIMKNSTGDVIEDTMASTPIQYLHGAGKIIPALETAIEGMEAGQRKEFAFVDAGLGKRFQFDLIVDEVRDATPEEIQNGKPSCGPGCCC